MKKELGIGLLLLTMIASATAFVDFKYNGVTTGNWVWDGDSWVNEEAATAFVEIGGKSYYATEAAFDVNEKLGQAWKSNVEVSQALNAPTRFTTSVYSLTVNPPDTTPGTAWTHTVVNEQTAGEHSQSSVSLNSYGGVLYTSYANVKSDALRYTEVKINP